MLGIDYKKDLYCSKELDGLFIKVKFPLISSNLVAFTYYLNPASARTHSAQALDPYSEMKLFGNHNKDCAQNCHSLYESISCTAQARSLAGSRYYVICILSYYFIIYGQNYIKRLSKNRAPDE